MAGIISGGGVLIGHDIEVTTVLHAVNFMAI